LWYRFIRSIDCEGIIVISAQPAEKTRMWRAADAVHIDVRGLEPPETMGAILQALDGGEVAGALVGHFDHEPIFLYPELDDHGWSYELMPSHCGGADCEDGVMVRMVRWGP
jgi:tRNA 2-thiouridine synthesizing protein A